LSDDVWDELIAMSPATNDRYLAPTKAQRYPQAKSATRAGDTLRSTIAVRKAGDEMEQAPGFIEADLVAHCGHTLAGEFLWTLTATDVFTGWTINVASRTKHQSTWCRAASDWRPLALSDGRPGFRQWWRIVNYQVLAWCETQGIAVTRGRPYRHNDNAHVEQKRSDRAPLSVPLPV
jgi:hypothetical protein